MKIRNQIWGVMNKILYPLFPALSQMKDRITIKMWIHDLEQKIYFCIIPLVAIIICIARPILSLWLGSDIVLISRTTIAIVSAFLLFSSATTPYYQYLIAKDYASKTIVLQASNVVFNIIFFFVFLKPLGFAAAIIGNVSAILSSFIVTLYYQRKDFNGLIFDSTKQFVKLLIIFISLIVIGLLISFGLNSDILRISVIPFIILLCTVLMYRQMHLITNADIIRYAGKNNTISDIALHLFISPR